MRIGVLTGSGTYALPGLAQTGVTDVATDYGAVPVNGGTLADDLEILHIARHGDGHERLSNQVNHRANILALRELGAEAIIATTVCGAVDPRIELGSLIVFDDLHFPSNRLPDGSLCTLHDRPGRPGRGHWIFEEPFSAPLRALLIAGAREADLEVRDRGCYGHVDGPRFNTRAEIASLALCGVSAVSQTAGPETVLCGEAAIPYALLGYATDYANGVKEEPTPVTRLSELIQASTESFARILARVLPALAGSQEIPRVGLHLGWE